jgi:hypothetical protein
MGTDPEDTAALHRVADVEGVWQFPAHVARAFGASGACERIDEDLGGARRPAEAEAVESGLEAKRWKTRG